MTDKELEKLNRRQLLEMMLKQAKRVEELESALSEKAEQLAEKENQLSDRRIALEKAGSIAKAALDINKVFESAQKAADQYLENIEASHFRCDEMLVDTKKRCNELISDAKKRSEEMLSDAKMQSEEMLSNAKVQSEEMLSETKKSCSAIEKQAAERVKALKAEVARIQFDWDQQPSEQE